jgi:hypothetical protein
LNDLSRNEQARPEPRHQYQECPVTATYPKTRLRTSQGDAELMAIGRRPAPAAGQLRELETLGVGGISAARM